MGVIGIKKRIISIKVLIYAFIYILTVSSCAGVSDITELADLSQLTTQSPTESAQELSNNDLDSDSNSLSEDNNDPGNDDNNILNDTSLSLSLEHDMGISINGQWFPIRQDVSGLLGALGDGYTLSTAPSCVFEGEDKEFDFGGLLISTNPNPDGTIDIWYSIYITGENFPTARGIRIGSTLDEVKAAYGSGFFWESRDVITFSISGIEGDITSPCIQFTVAQGVVTAIEIYYPTNV